VILEPESKISRTTTLEFQDFSRTYDFFQDLYEPWLMHFLHNTSQLHEIELNRRQMRPLVTFLARTIRVLHVEECTAGAMVDWNEAPFRQRTKPIGLSQPIKFVKTGYALQLTDSIVC